MWIFSKQLAIYLLCQILPSYGMRGDVTNKLFNTLWNIPLVYLSDDDRDAKINILEMWIFSKQLAIYLLCQILPSYGKRGDVTHTNPMEYSTI